VGSGSALRYAAFRCGSRCREKTHLGDDRVKTSTGRVRGHQHRQGHRM